MGLGFGAEAPTGVQVEPGGSGRPEHGSRDSHPRAEAPKYQCRPDPADQTRRPVRCGGNINRDLRLTADQQDSQLVSSKTKTARGKGGLRIYL